jgi:hypothetical protein
MLVWGVPMLGTLGSAQMVLEVLTLGLFALLLSVLILISSFPLDFLPPVSVLLFFVKKKIFEI